MESACRFSSAKVVEIVKCFLNIVSKIRQICIISARFCGWKFALVAQIDMNIQSELLDELFVVIFIMLAFLNVYWDQNIEYTVKNVHFSLQNKVNVTVLHDFCLNIRNLRLKSMRISKTLAPLTQRPGEISVNDVDFLFHRPWSSIPIIRIIY